MLREIFEESEKLECARGKFTKSSTGENVEILVSVWNNYLGEWNNCVLDL